MVSCPNCGDKRAVGQTMDITTKKIRYYCNNCGYTFSVKPDKFDTGAHIGKQLRRIELILFLAIGVLVCAIFLPILIPAVVLYFFYLLFPSEYKLRLEAEKQLAATGLTGGEIEPHIQEYIADHSGLFITKSFMKLAVIGSATYAFLTVHQLLALITLLIGYFSLPSSYKENQPEKHSLAYIRGALLSLGIAALFILVFHSVVLAIMAFAFFFFVPDKMPSGKESTVFTEFNKVNKWIFAGTMILVALAIFFDFPPGYGWNLGINFSSPLFILMVTILAVSFFTGFTAPPNSRAYIGIIAMTITMIAYTSTFPGEVGTAVFGAWWPQVEHYSKAITEPLGTAYEEVTAGMGNAWLMMTNPSEWYVKQMELERTKSSAITTGGSVRSIEVNEYRLLSAQLDPEQPLVGTIELENKGEFTAKDVTINLQKPSYKKTDSRTASLIQNSVYTITSCTAGTWTADKPAICKWERETYPGTPLFASFKYEKWGEIGSCSCSLPASDCKTLGGSCSRCIVETTPETKTCTDKGGIVTYSYGGSYVTINFTYNYRYKVNVSLPMEVMDYNLYIKRLQNKEITPRKIESQYSGGPVRATIWTQKQPVPAGEEIFGEISILNQGSGKIKEATVNLYMPKTIDNLNAVKDQLTITSLATSSFRSCEEKATDAGWENYKKITCTLGSTIEKRDQSARYGFLFRYGPEDNAGDKKLMIDTKSVIFIGDVDYIYEGVRTQELDIIRAPLQ